MDKVDCVVVGAGPAGSACALNLARKGVETVLLERGGAAGEKNVASFVLFTPALERLIPDYLDEAPLERLVADQSLLYMTENDHVQLRMRFQSHGDRNLAFTAYRSKFDEWFAGKASEAGAEVLTGVLVTDLLIEDGRVVGVKVGEEELLADVVIGADGINTTVGRAAGLVTDDPTRYLLGVKEVLDLPGEVIEDRFQLRKGEGTCWEGFGYPVTDICGAITLYTNNDSVTLAVFGWVNEIGEKGIDLYERLQWVKGHPFIGSLVAGSTTREYQAHLISDGGRINFGNLYSDGVLLCGEAGGMVMNYAGVPSAMLSGLMAAETVALARKKKDFSRRTLKKYIGFLESTALARCMYSNRKASDYLVRSGRDNLPAYMDSMMAIAGESLANEFGYLSPRPYPFARNLYFQVGENMVPGFMRGPARTLVKAVEPLTSMRRKLTVRRAMK